MSDATLLRLPCLPQLLLRTCCEELGMFIFIFDECSTHFLISKSVPLSRKYVSGDGCLCLMSEDVCASCDFSISTNTPFADEGWNCAISGLKPDGDVHGSEDDYLSRDDSFNKSRSDGSDSKGDVAWEAVCVPFRYWQYISVSRLVPGEHYWPTFLCDGGGGSCAKPSHMAIYQSEAMTMHRSL